MDAGRLGGRGLPRSPAVGPLSASSSSFNDTMCTAGRCHALISTEIAVDILHNR